MGKIQAIQALPWGSWATTASGFSALTISAFRLSVKEDSDSEVHWKNQDKRSIWQ